MSTNGNIRLLGYVVNFPCLDVIGGVAQWLERRSMTGELSLACAMTCC